MREKLHDQGYDREEEFFRKQEREAIEKLRQKKAAESEAQREKDSEKAGE